MAADLPSEEGEIGSLSMLRDVTGKMGVEAVASAAQSRNFTPVAPDMALGYTHDAIWLRFGFDSGTRPGDWLLEVSPAVLDEVTLYSPRHNGYAAQREGNLLPAGTRALPHHNFVFSLDGDGSGQQWYYLRVHTDSTMQIRLRPWRAGNLVQLASLQGNIYGAYFGMALLVIGFNLVFWIWLREPLHLTYSGYVLVNGISFAFMSGYAEPMVPDIPGLADHLQKGIALVQLSTLGFFFGWLFRFRRHLTRFNLLNNTVATGILGYGVLVSLGWAPYLGRATVFVGIVQLVAIESLAIWLLLRGRRELLLYLTAFTAFVLSAILLMMRALGWIGNYVLLDYLPLLTSAIHMVLINAGLAQRARLAEHARRTADQVTLSTSIQNERELEQRVIERTKALERANAALLMEVAEREELQGQLRLALAKEREALAVQRQFVAMVSHEFRTPLAIIDATAQRILLQHGADVATLSPPIQKIRRGVQRLTNLIDTFLGEERVPAQGEVVMRERLDLHVLAKTCVDQHLPLSSGLIHCPAPDEPVLVEGDAAMLTLVLSNLVDNALKYSPPGHPITLQIGHDDRRGWIDVIDYGVGIPPEEHEHVFGKHVRLGAVAGVGGTGLGLHIARNAARNMGGDIELESEVDKGSCFRLWLPRVTTVEKNPH